MLSEGSPLVDGGLYVGAAGLALLGAYHLQAGWSLGTDDADALVAAVREVGFPVGTPRRRWPGGGFGADPHGGCWSSPTSRRRSAGASCSSTAWTGRWWPPTPR